MDRLIAQTIMLTACTNAALRGSPIDPLGRASPFAGSSGMRFELKAGKKALAQGASMQDWFLSLRARGAVDALVAQFWVDRGSHLDEAGHPVFVGEWQWSIIVRHGTGNSREAWRIFWEGDPDGPSVLLLGRWLDMHHDGPGLQPSPKRKTAAAQLDDAMKRCEDHAAAHGAPEWATLFRAARRGGADPGSDADVPREVLPAGRGWTRHWELLRRALRGDLFWRWPVVDDGEEVQALCAAGRGAVLDAMAAATQWPRRWA